MRGLDLAAIGNCSLGALVDQGGRIVWCCFPRLDGDPVFCRLLDGSEGDGIGFADLALEEAVSASQSYLGNTAILVTTLADRSGAVLRITDFAPRFKHYGRIFRPAMLVRRIEPLRGSPRIRIRMRPRFGHGAFEPQRTFGSNHVRYLSGDLALRLTTDAPISYIAEECRFVLAGSVHMIIGPDESLTAPVAGTTEDFLERTQDYWEEWSRYLSVPFEWQDAVIRAAITLKLCSFEETGAIVAALTTSIPESPHSGRNWDYRYCWLRDAYFVVHALNRLGATRTMEDFIRYITNVVTLETDGRLKPVYSIIPGLAFPEREINSLSGYRGMGPVRVGNAAAAQIQNDSYGSVVLAATQMFIDRRLPQPGDRRLFELLEGVGRQAIACAFEPDAGLWEHRDRLRIHTYSSVMCWAACDRLARIAAVLALPERARHWREAADIIRAEVLRRAWSERRSSFVESLDGDTLDASLLLLQEVGFVRADDPRFLGTVAAVDKTLRRDGHLMRYVEPDQFGEPENAFTVCTFWYVDALAAIGRREEAREIFEHVLACRNHVGLLSEDLDPRTGELWGNFPQTYSMVGLVVSAMRLSRSWEQALIWGHGP